jgi:hypothetical protein
LGTRRRRAPSQESRKASDLEVKFYGRHSTRKGRGGTTAVVDRPLLMNINKSSIRREGVGPAVRTHHLLESATVTASLQTGEELPHQFLLQERDPQRRGARDPPDRER